MSIVTNIALRRVLAKIAEVVAGLRDCTRHVRGRNLLLGTQPTQISNANYEMAEFKLAEAPADGETFTISMDAKLGSDRTQYYFYNSGGNVPLVSCKVVDGRVEATFKWVSRNASGSTADNTSVRIYQYPRTGTSASSISHVKLERGNIATEWCRADEDYDTSPIAYFDHEEPAGMSRIIQPGWAPAGAQVVYDQSYKRFFAISGGKWYGRWIGCEQMGTLYGSASATTTPSSGVTPKTGKLYICQRSAYPYAVIDESIGLETLLVPI